MIVPRITLILIITVMTALVLGSCTRQPDSAAAPKWSAAGGYDVQAAGLIDEALALAAEGNLKVARIEAAASGIAAPVPVLPAGVDLPDELEQRISVEWSGPVQPLLESMASHLGYAFRETGSPPAQPLLITIHQRDGPVWRTLRDIGAILASSGTVVVNPADRLIELRYQSQG